MSSKSNNPVNFGFPRKATKYQSLMMMSRLKRLSAAYSAVTPSDVYNSLNKVAVDGLVDDSSMASFVTSYWQGGGGRRTLLVK